MEALYEFPALETSVQLEVLAAVLENQEDRENELHGCFLGFSPDGIAVFLYPGKIERWTWLAYWPLPSRIAG